MLTRLLTSLKLFRRHRSLQLVLIMEALRCISEVPVPSSKQIFIFIPKVFIKGYIFEDKFIVNLIFSFLFL